LVKKTLAIGEYLAEMYVDSRSTPAVYHYIVTRKDSAEIISWGQEFSAETAERSALDTILQLNSHLKKVARAG
jgi:hypothetical protein